MLYGSAQDAIESYNPYDNRFEPLYEDGSPLRPHNLFVVNSSGERGSGEELVLLNPEIQMPKGSETGQQGCLSLPGVSGNVKRPASVRLSAYDLKGNAIERVVDGFLARVLQHENDHLNGVLFFDRMSEEAKSELDDQLLELQSDFRAKQRSGSIPSDEELMARLATWHEKYA